MKEYFQNKYRISTARVTWHNYCEGMYFITICTHQHKPYFGRIVSRTGLEENQLKLTEVGRIVKENLQQITCHYHYAEIPVFVIMPNHIHFIIIIDSPDNPNGDVARNVSTNNNNQTMPHNRRDVACYVSDIPSYDPEKNVTRNYCNEVSKRDLLREYPSDHTNGDNNNQTMPQNGDVARNVSTDNGKQKTISPQKGSLATVIRGFKSAITKYARERGIAFAWQTRFYDRIVRNQNELNAIVEYIENNPYK